jgi:hypothetical protein
MSTLTSAERPQLAQLAMTERTPFSRTLARVIGGPGLERMSGAPIARAQLSMWASLIVWSDSPWAAF